MRFFQHKVCLITGASRGIGAALARELAPAGARLALFARSKDDLDKISQEAQARGAETLALTGDVRRPEEVRAAVERAVSHFGGLDVVIANAGVGSQGFFLDFSLDDFREVMEVNFFGVLHTIYAALPHLRQRQDARLGILSSVAGKLPFPTGSAYSASKFALHGLGEALRTEEEIIGGPKVTMLCPGYVATNIQNASIHRGIERQPPSLLTMKAEVAARQIMDALAAGVPEASITGHAKALVALRRFAPRFLTDGIMKQAFKRMNRG